MEERTLENNNTLFNLYCHYHKHTTKVIGYPIVCEKCLKENIENMIPKNYEGGGKSKFIYQI